MAGLIGLRLGLADHFGWAIAVTADADHNVVDRRRIELVEPGVATAPFEHDSKGLDDVAAAALIDAVRASIARATAAAFAELPAGIAAVSVRQWPANFPTDLATLRRAPYDARADGVMYRQEIAEVARARGWDVHVYDAKDVVGQAAARLGGRAADVLDGPRARLGAPWAKDHRVALAATVVI